MQVPRRQVLKGLLTAAVGFPAYSASAASVWGEEVRPDVDVDVDAGSSSSGALMPCRLLFNENPLGPSPEAIKAACASVAQGHLYPFREAGELAMRLRQLHGLSTVEVPKVPSLNPTPEPEEPTGLLLGVGTTEILRALAWSATAEGGEVVEPSLSYGSLGALAVGKPGPGPETSRVFVPLDAQDRIDVDGMIAAIRPQTRVVVLTNPNNPTGTVLARSEIERLAASVPDSAVLLVDEAYIEYADPSQTESVIDLAGKKENVLVTRTFSKIHGLAGLRVGYAVGNQAILDRLRPYMLGPLAFNAAGIAAANASLDDAKHLERSKKLTRLNIARWQDEMPRFGFEVVPSQASFAWVRFGFDCTDLVEHLTSKDVLISHGRRWNLDDCARISVGTEQECDRLLAGLRSFKPV